MRFLQVIPKLAILSNAEVLNLFRVAQDKGKIKVKGALEDPKLAVTLLEEFNVAFFDTRVLETSIGNNPGSIGR